MRKLWLKTSICLAAVVLLAGSGPPAPEPAWPAAPHPAPPQPPSAHAATAAAHHANPTLHSVAEVDQLLAATRLDDATERLSAALAAAPDDAALHDRYIEVALQQGRFSTALRRVARARAALGSSPKLHYHAARAHYRLGHLLGRAVVRRVPGAAVGEFHDDLLLVRSRAGSGQFLCCPAESAIYQIRVALDGGFDEPAAHLLHARIWLELGRPELAARVLESQAARLLKQPDAQTLALFADVARARGNWRDYLAYTRRQAACDPARHDELLARAFVAVARDASERGDTLLHLHWLRRAVTLRPKDTALRRQLADALWDAGQADVAAPHYRALLAEITDLAERRHLLDRILSAAQAD